LNTLLRNQKGNIAVSFALTLVPMLLAVGAGVDMVRANHARTVLQGAADAAALGGGASRKTDARELQQIVNDYLAANGAADVVDSITEVTSALDKGDNSFQVTIKGELKTSFMFLAGINNMELNAVSQVKMGGQALEVALVLDNTTSMSVDGKMDALKSAAKLLVDKVFEAKASGAYVKVGLVPFSEYVNVGLSAKGSSWLDVPDTEYRTEDVTSVTYPNADKTDCHMEDRVYYADGVPYTYQQEVCNGSLGDPVTTVSTVTTKWSWMGCVGSRNAPLDLSIGSPSTTYPGLLFPGDNNWWCPTEIADLTGDKAGLKAEIDTMRAVGNTYIPSGLLWGWNLLDNSAPYTTAKPAAEMRTLEGKKAIVLMTDGENTLSATYPYHWGNNAVDADNITEKLCVAAKADGIQIYTVAFKVSSLKAKDLLTNCATATNMAFAAEDNAALLAAFEDIGKQLSALRLSR
jgi:Flp pilus assembly protein TadG